MAKDGYASLSQRSARFGVAETGSGLLITPSVSPSARITWFLSTCCSVLRPAGSAACCQLEQVLMQRRDSVSTPPAEFSGRWRTRVWLAASRFGVWDVITLTTVAGEYHYRVATPATSWARHWRDLSFKRNESFEKARGALGDTKVARYGAQLCKTKTSTLAIPAAAARGASTFRGVSRTPSVSSFAIREHRSSAEVGGGSDPADVAVVIHTPDSVAESSLEGGRTPPVHLRGFYGD